MSIQNTTINIVWNYVTLNHLRCSLVGIVGLNLAGGMNVFSQVNVVYCQVEVSATGRSLLHSSPAVCVCVSMSVIMRNSNRQQ